MAFYKIIARLSHISFVFLKKLTSFLDAAFSGFWLGVMSNKSLDYSDELYYKRNKNYSDDKYNLSGLFDWEKAVIEKHFANAKNILLIAAGGGREAIALHKMGFEVEGYECNPTLVEYANTLIQKNDLNCTIRYLQRNSVPEEINKYDGIIIGWGAYSHIPGSKKRLSFLNGLTPLLQKDTPLMISFLVINKKTRRDSVVKNISNFFRFFTRKDRTELGDKLEPDYIHYFTADEIKNEIIASNLRLIEYSDSEYGCLVAGI